MKKQEEKCDMLRLDKQLCFPLYACAKEVVRRYKPFLDELDLTYTQYITMMVMWEKKEINVKCLGKILYLDSGTLTPVLKKLEWKGYLTRERSKEDERNLRVMITDKGIKLKGLAEEVPMKVGKCVKLEAEEAEQLYELLYKVLGCMDA
ncbi:MAG: MarR family transcriptional regulator [Lachnospiraceae bacterium]|nr:MarR family transcriptional regulator [Lachnospiraceae bacterium]